MACPFFLPTQKWDAGMWQHPARLPLGGGWRGSCSAPGHEGAEPSDQEQQDLCNLGYAATCSWLPVERSCDAVRFSVTRDDGSRLQLCFVCESAHHPVAHGTLEYDSAASQWISTHADPRLQRMAECYVESYLSRPGRTRTDAVIQSIERAK